MKKNKIKMVVFLLLFAFHFLTAEVIFISIIDRDLGIPLEGVKVELLGSGEIYYSDMDGIIHLNIPNIEDRFLLLFTTPGYEEQRYSVDNETETLYVEMILSGFVEGSELVVERTIIAKTDEEAGISEVITNEEMDSTANFGLVEDVMSSVKTLPGVGYTSLFNGRPSIRGGDPNEMGCIIDGFYILNPYHWGGAYSIFNPNMIESAKLSHGIYSAKYGRALSGLLEISSVVPNEPDFHLTGGFATTSTDLFSQIPIGENSGLLFGGKITYLDTLSLFAPDLMSQPPYIRDLYAKLYLNPSPEFEMNIIGFFGADGIGTDQNARISNDTVNIRTIFDWRNINTFGSVSFKYMPSDKFILKGLGGINYFESESSADMRYSGTRNYTSDFISTYDGTAYDPDGVINGLIGGSNSYNLDGVNSSSNQKLNSLQGQLKFDSEYLVSQNSILSFGLGVVLGSLDNYNRATIYTPIFNSGTGTFEFGAPFEMDANDSNTINSSVYFIWMFGGDHTTVSGELGLRAEHYYLWQDNFSLNTYPVLNPRAQISWEPIRNGEVLDSLQFSFGTGLFSNFPFNTSMAQEDFGLNSFELKPDQAWFSLIGVEATINENWRLKLDTYYKYYLNRLYVTRDPLAGSNLKASTEGKGHIFGFDLMIQKKESRVLDGYLSYSFVYAQFLNPPLFGTDSEEAVVPGQAPVGSWYFPSYHRYHSLNLVMNWKPANGWKITLQASLASGNPQLKPGSITSIAAPNPADGGATVVEWYARNDIYDQNLRSQISCPIDIRISYSKFFNRSRGKWEVYLGAEDVLTNLFSPEGTTTFDPFTGEEVAAKSDFSIGFPMFSLGYKLSY